MPRSTLEATAIAPPGAMAACRNEDPATRHAVVIRMGRDADKRLGAAWAACNAVTPQA